MDTLGDLELKPYNTLDTQTTKKEYDGLIK
jgi:hypothetical protein